MLHKLAVVERSVSPTSQRRAALVFDTIGRRFESHASLTELDFLQTPQAQRRVLICSALRDVWRGISCIQASQAKTWRERRGALCFLQGSPSSG